MANAPKANVRKRNASRKGGASATRKTAQAPTRQRFALPWLNHLMIFAGVAFVAVAAVQAWLTLDAIPVEQISVKGSLEHTQREAVESLVQPALVGGFLSADLATMQQQLESLPWIYSANVRRRWPNALEIHVVEQLPIAHWGEAGFLNHEAQVFQSPDAQRWEGLPTLRGPEGSARHLVARYQRLEELLAPIGREVVTLIQDPRGQLDAELDNGIHLLLGNDEFVERVQRFVALYQRELRARDESVARVDLRYASGVAVAFESAEQLAGLTE
ncbi:MAG: FtsQ-type POTRA domain-containing protein [Halieaceae bacterium]|nr:FtsQ-type POTRA domain-containing protein [Halieaceae bacterium]